ncbi:hypothetical protein FIBSPDRAFT_965502 [Athelia psychrophila]|uniref:Uncharacterized protein n=1 Tax=Athelia psychrophila TaxID=1759441 RepID=A0A165WF56_9AGAM|nr:hypothetical protein FIBSPDRAFT_965502 [Fibularhizoctonia sp. CBS 109695]
MESVAGTRSVEIDAAEMKRQARLENEEVVDRQLNKYYVDEGILDVDHPGWVYFKLDLLRLKRTSMREGTFQSLAVSHGDAADPQHELSTIEVPPEKIAELLAEGRIDELTELLVEAGREYNMDHTMTGDII